MIMTSAIDTPLGGMTAAAEDEALIGLWFIGQKYYPAQTDLWRSEPEHPLFQSLRDHLADYFSKEAPVLDIRLAPRGTAFQRAVWDALLQIPPGQVASYGQIARQIAQSRGLTSMSAQAVGGAIGRNPISILIPCHRALGSSGALTGYAGGLDRKAALLRLETASH